MNSGVYHILHKASGRRYIGSSRQLSVRLQSHRAALRAGRHHCPRLQRAWSRDGEEAFLFEVLELVEGDKHAVLDVEQRYLDGGGDLYNARKRALSNQPGRQSEEVRAHLSEVFKAKYAAEPELREQLRDMNRKATQDPEVKARTVSAMVEASRTEEGRRRRSETAKRLWAEGRLTRDSDEMRRRVMMTKRCRDKKEYAK